MRDNSFSEEIDPDDEFYVPYAERPEWSDVKPLPSVVEVPGILLIDYSARFLDCFDYFRAVIESGEKTHRVLALTADAIELNAANYTVWQYRRDVLQTLGIPSKLTGEGLSDEFQAEFEFSSDAIEKNQKNYQVWHHHKILLQWAGGFNEETGRMELDPPEARKLFTQAMEITSRFLEKDAKNYHAWQHRQWILHAFKIYDEELDYVDTLLQEDARNNSAWNQRHYLLKERGDITLKVISDEVLYTWKHILKTPSNESSWNYLEGLFELVPEIKLGNNEQILELCEELFRQNVLSSPMLNLMVTIYEQKMADTSVQMEQRVAYRDRALEICELLENTVDKMRAPYWTYTKSTLKIAPETETKTEKQTETKTEKQTE